MYSYQVGDSIHLHPLQSHKCLDKVLYYKMTDEQKIRGGIFHAGH